MHVEDSPLVLGKEDQVFKAAFSNKLHSPPPRLIHKTLLKGRGSPPFVEKRGQPHPDHPERDHPARALTVIISRTALDCAPSLDSQGTTQS